MEIAGDHYMDLVGVGDHYMEDTGIPVNDQMVNEVTASVVMVVPIYTKIIQSKNSKWIMITMWIYTTQNNDVSQVIFSI